MARFSLTVRSTQKLKQLIYLRNYTRIILTDMLEESLFHWFHCNMFQISHRSRPRSHKHLQGRWTNTSITKPNRTYLPQLILTPILGHGKTAKKRKLICDGNKLINNNANEWQPDNIHFIKELLLTFNKLLQSLFTIKNCLRPFYFSFT